MRDKRFKSCLKTSLGVVMSLIFIFSLGLAAFAKTSDQATLSVYMPGAGYVTSSDGLNVRTGPSTSYRKIAGLAKDTKVMILSRGSNGWDYVQYDDKGNCGYVSNTYIREYDLEYYCQVNTTKDPLNLRYGMGTNYGVKATIPKGSYIPELICGGKWDYVLYGTADGYVDSSLVKRLRYY